MKYGLLFHYWMNSKDSTCDYHEVAKKIKAAGFDVIEIDGGDLYRMSDEEIDKLKGTLTTLGLEVSINFGTPPEIDPSADDPQTRKAGIEYLEKLLYKMHRLGSKVLIGALVTTWPVDWNVEHDKEKTWAYAVESLREVCKTAEKLEITMNLEILNRFESFLINDVEECLKFTEEVGSPNVKLLVDTFHANIEEDSVVEAVRKAGKNLGHMHLGEANRKLPGLGSIPWKGIGEALREIDFKGYLVVEPFMLKNGPLGKAIHLWREYFPGITEEEYDKMLVDSLAFLKENFEQ